MLIALLTGCGGHPAPLPHVLAPAPNTPNCVYSKAPASDTVHAIEPLHFSGEPTAFWARLHQVVMAMPRVVPMVDTPTYRHYVFSTALFGFKDDVQFELNADQQLVHVRSASRVGKSDLGVNRKRIEAIRTALWQNRAAHP